MRDVAGFDDCLDHYDDEHPAADPRPPTATATRSCSTTSAATLLDAALFNIAERARVVLCGSISTGYKPQRPDVGLYYYQLLTMRRSRMEGFLVTDYADRFDEARARPADVDRRGPPAPAVRRPRGPRAGARWRSTACSAAATSASSSSSL